MIVLSQVFVLSLQLIAACPVPETPQLSSPSETQLNVSTQPTFSWNAVSNSCPIVYEFRAGKLADTSDCASLPNITLDFTPSATLTTPLHYTLVSSSDYTWCVRAIANDGTSGTYSKGHFKTRADTVTTPLMLATIPDSSLQRQGDTIVQLRAQGGEEGSTAHFFLKGVNGSNDTEVGSVMIGNDVNGAFSVATNLSLFGADTGRQLYEFYTKIERPTGPSTSIFSLPSNLIRYNFDPSLRLTSPVLRISFNNQVYSNDVATAGMIEWSAIPNATQYKVWRRLGKEAYSSDGSTYYLGNRPFKMVAAVAGNILQFDDRTELSGFNDPNGVSYFVTAYSNNSSSPRSNSVSFSTVSDPNSPVVGSGQSINFIPLKVGNAATGRDVIGFLCNINRAGYFDGDNSPDLKTDVRYIANPTKSCGSYTLNEYLGANAIPFYGWDALLSAADSQDFPGANCIVASKVNGLDPNTPYCFASRIVNPAGKMTSFSTFSARTPINNLAPADFAGLDSVIPTQNGTGAIASWSLPADNEVNRSKLISYKISSTTRVDDSGNPIFDFTQAGTLSEAGTTSVEIKSLETGTQYYFAATAVDQDGNSNTPQNYLSATTLDNRPQSSGIDVLPGTKAEPYKVPLKFSTFSRLMGIQGLHIQLGTLQYKLHDSPNWITVDPQHILGADLNNIAFGSTDSDAKSSTIIFNTLPYFSGEQNFRVQIRLVDSFGNESSFISSEPTVVFQGVSINSGFQQQNLSGCSLHSHAPLQIQALLLPLVLGIFSVWILRRRFKLN